MPLDDRIQDAAEAALARVSAHLDEEVQGLIDELQRAVHEEQSAALQRVRATLEAEAEDARAQVAAAVREARANTAGAAWLTEHLRRLDGPHTLGEILDGLIEATADRSSRAGIFLWRDGRLRGWRLAGFGPDLIQARAREFDFEEESVLWRAAHTRLPARGEPGAPGLTGAAFAALSQPSTALAVPLTVDGQVVALLYADTQNGPNGNATESWVRTIETLGRYGARCLEAVTAIRTARLLAGVLSSPQGPSGSEDHSGHAAGTAAEEAEASRRYARLLVSEIKLYQEEAVRVGRERRDLLERLRPEIERARSLYEERLGPADEARRLYFDEELVRTLAEGDLTRLGRS